MPRESEFLTVMRVTSPRSIRRRIRIAPLLSAASLAIFVPLLGLIVDAVATERGGARHSWGVGLGLLAFALVLVPVYSIWVVKTRRAMTAYALILLGLLPGPLGILDGSARLCVAVLGANATLVIALGLVLGLSTLPFVVRARRTQFQAGISAGYLRRSLDPKRATWDAQYDKDDDMSKEWLTRPGCLIRLLPWVGPAIGMRIADVFGRSTANLVMVGAFLSGGYALVYFWIARAAVEMLEFRRMEKELGRPIMLAEEPAGA